MQPIYAALSTMHEMVFIKYGRSTTKIKNTKLARNTVKIKIHNTILKPNTLLNNVLNFSMMNFFFEKINLELVRNTSSKLNESAVTFYK